MLASAPQEGLKHRVRREKRSKWVETVAQSQFCPFCSKRPQISRCFLWKRAHNNPVHTYTAKQSPLMSLLAFFGSVSPAALFLPRPTKWSRFSPPRRDFKRTFVRFYFWVCLVLLQSSGGECCLLGRGWKYPRRGVGGMWTVGCADPASATANRCARMAVSDRCR